MSLIIILLDYLFSLCRVVVGGVVIGVVVVNALVVVVVVEVVDTVCK